MSAAILIVEDEAHIAEGLRFNLAAEGYRAEIAASGEAALERLATAGAEPGGGFDVVVLDVMLPGRDGFAVAAAVRAAGNFVPILMLTARGTAEDVVRGFGAGADDYLPKPFDLAVLLARIHALLRRGAWRQPDSAHFEFPGWRVDFDRLRLEAGDRSCNLTRMEADLLRYFIRHEGVAIGRKAILQEVWGVSGEADTRPIDNFVVRLRRYIETDPARPRHLLTVRGVGYRFVAKPQ